MKLDAKEEAMLAGDLGRPKQWAMHHMVKVGRMFDADDFVQISQAHMMADPESIGSAGLEFVEDIADNPEPERRVAVPMITDPRGVDLNYYRPLGQTEDMADIERRFIAACGKLGILMTNTCINYQTIMPPVLGEHVAFGDTGVVIYCNSALGARSNFEGGPSALAAGLTGRTPRYGLHLDRFRQGTHRFVVRQQPEGLTGWGTLGAVIGAKAGSYWAVPVIEGIERVPNSDEMKHFGAAMASYGSTPLFHIIGITPEAPTLAAVGATNLAVADITSDDLAQFQSRFGARGDAVDLVVFAAPQLSLAEMQTVADLCDGRELHDTTAMIVCTSPSVYADSARLGLVTRIEATGAKVLEGTCFYNQYAREIGEANGWKRLLSNSAKIVNILGGYGYNTALAPMEKCVASACAGRIV